MQYQIDVKTSIRMYFKARYDTDISKIEKFNDNLSIKNTIF